MITYCMLYAVAVGLPVLVAAYAGAAVLRRHGRAERGVWVGALVLALLLPVVLVARPFEALRAPTADVTGAPGATADADDGRRIPGLPLPTLVILRTEGSPSTLDRLAVLAWLLASLGLTLRWAISSRRLARISSSWRAGSVDGSDVWITDGSGPAVTGALRSRILVPDWLLHLPDGQRSLVLLHEEEHVRARDPWLMTLSRLARIATPWNPVVWLLSSRLLRAVETDCDRRVLRKRPDVRKYCDTLFAISARKPSRLIGAAAFAESQIPLQKRILAMTTPPRRLSAVAVVTLLAVGGLLLVGSCGVPVPTEREAQQQASVLENPDWFRVVVRRDGFVVLNDEVHAIADVSAVAAGLVEASSEPLVTVIDADADVPYRFITQVQEGLMDADAVRVVFAGAHSVSSSAADGLSIVLPEAGYVWAENVSQRNILALHVLPSGVVRVRRGEATETDDMTVPEVTVEAQVALANNPLIIVALSSDEGVTYGQFMAAFSAVYEAKIQRIGLMGITER